MIGEYNPTLGPVPPPLSPQAKKKANRNIREFKIGAKFFTKKHFLFF